MIAKHDRARGSIGIVAIGRNEGARLEQCLHSIAGWAATAVYVDSGSTDGSVQAARSRGVTVVELDMAIPFTAARARNEGFRRLRSLAPGVEYVQFVDGDCEIVDGWLARAGGFLDDHPDVAAVCGRRRERFPQASVYNMLCDVEWDTPVGAAAACGGDAMIRAAVFETVGGFCDGLIAGEEPELCARIRAAGWRIWRLDAEMTRHDAAIKEFRQWWRRSLRSGYGFAQGMNLDKNSPEPQWRREVRSAWIWGLGIPLATVCAVGVAGVAGLALLSVYPLQVLRLALRGRRTARENWWRAWFLVITKFPEVIGQTRYYLHHLGGMRSRIIEYK